MSQILDSVYGRLTEYFGTGLPSVNATDVIEILLIAVFLYELLIWIKNTRAWMLFRGLIVIVVFFILAAILQMNTILWLGERLVNASVIALVVVFQPELRRALETLGRNDFRRVLDAFRITRADPKRFDDKMVSDLTKACFSMGAVKTGALIVIEGDMRLTEYIRTGIDLDALVTSQLLINIFEKNTPLHDGAVIIRGNRIVAATCYLPLSENMEFSKDLGTRHRAGIGMSELCDGLVIIVSEETGAVSTAREGELRRNLTPEQLTQELVRIQILQETPESGKDKERPDPVPAASPSAGQPTSERRAFADSAQLTRPIDLAKAAGGDTSRMKSVKSHRKEAGHGK